MAIATTSGCGRPFPFGDSLHCVRHVAMSLLYFWQELFKAVHGEFFSRIEDNKRSVVVITSSVPQRKCKGPPPLWVLEERDRLERAFCKRPLQDDAAGQHPPLVLP